MNALEELIERIDRRVVTIFMRHGGWERPIWHYITADGRERILPATLSDRDDQMALVRVALEIDQAISCVMIMEAWAIDTRSKDIELDLEALNRTGLQDHPDRIETLSYSGEDRDLGQMYAQRLIIRQGPKVSLGPLTYLPRAMQASGRMLGVLPRAGATLQ